MMQEEEGTGVPTSDDIMNPAREDTIYIGTRYITGYAEGASEEATVR
jgi:hypothetical protein